MLEIDALEGQLPCRLPDEITYGHHPVFAYRKPDGLWARLTRKSV